MEIKHRQFIAEVFKMETGLNAVKISQIGFHQYMIEAEDGHGYMYTC